MDMLKKDKALMTSLIDPEQYLDAIGRLTMMLTSRKPFIELYRRISVLFPKPNEGPFAAPHRMATDALERFKREVFVPLLMTKRKLHGCRGDISRYLSLRVDVPLSTLEKQERLETQVQELVARFQPAYEELSTVIRPGFPELWGVIEEIDAFCGMGKLRMDVQLADFSHLSPVNDMPNVLRGETQLSSQVAPKNLKPTYILKKFPADKKDDFYREMEAMRSALQQDNTAHPNVAEVEFAFEEGVGDIATYYIAMPLYECGSMEWFRKHVMETRDRDAVLRALVEIAEGLSFLHCIGVIHGDLKPENIMFEGDSPTARPKLIDFNFSGIDQKTYALLKVKTAALGASLGYVPPEFSDGRTTSRTRESDVYSLGQTYRVLLGVAPDPSTTAAGQIAAEQQETFKSQWGPSSWTSSINSQSCFN
jgi:serine/threonine protein kinase